MSTGSEPKQVGQGFGVSYRGQLVTAALFVFVLALTGCSQTDRVAHTTGNQTTATPVPEVSTPTSNIEPGDKTKVALMKFIATVDYVIGAAAQTARERGSATITVSDLQSGVSDYGITEDPTIWSVVETANGFGIGAPVFGLGVCGVTVNPTWTQRPGAEELLETTECTGTTTAAPTAPPAMKK